MADDLTTDGIQTLNTNIAFRSQNCLLTANDIVIIVQMSCVVINSYTINFTYTSILLMLSLFCFLTIIITSSLSEVTDSLVIRGCAH